MTRHVPSRLPFLILVLVPAFAFADSTRITSGLQQAISWLVTVGLLVSTVGLVFAAWKLSSGKPDGKENVTNVLIGSIIMMSASGLIALLSSWFS